MAGKIKIPFLGIYCSAVIFLILSLLSLKKSLSFEIFLFCFIFLLGAVGLKNSQSLPLCHIAKYISYKNNYTYLVSGYIDSEPTLKNNKTSFIFKTREIQCGNLKHNCCGRILVYIKGKQYLNYAEELILRGNLHRPFGSRNPKQKSYRNYLYNQSIFSIMSVKSSVVRLNKYRGLIPKRFALWLKNKIEVIISKHASPVAASILEAMILGEKRNIPVLVYNSMIKSGTVHILVVSGFNVGLVAFIIIIFLKLVRLSRNMRFVLSVPLLILYCLMTGASNPVVRATVMAIVFMSAYFVKREPDIYNSCAVAMLFILGINPRQLFDIGFQLSFASVISIVYLYPRIKSLLRTDYLKIEIVRRPIEACLVSFSAWLGTMGLVAYYFKIFSPVTVLANLFIVPLATLITLCGFSLVIIDLTFPILSPFFAYSSNLATFLLIELNAFLLKLPAAYFYLS